MQVYGGIDTLVNNAGILRDKTLINMSEAEWDDVITVHLEGTFVPCKAACKANVPKMANRGMAGSSTPLRPLDFTVTTVRPTMVLPRQALLR